MFLPEPRERESLINNIFTKDQLKKLYCHALRVDIDDNNDKAEIITDLIGPEFQEIGTGTNRVAYIYTPDNNRKFRGGAGLVYEFALDRRGFADTWAEFKRSSEIPKLAIKVYETNLLISIQEYITIMDEEEFRLNEEGIKEVLSMLAEDYIFEDIGFSLKNYENWGYRDNGDIVCVDLGYIYPKRGNEQALACPRCRAQLKYNSNYTGFVCQNDSCRRKYSFLDVRQRMNLSMENLEDRVLFDIMNVDMPNFDTLTDTQLI